MKPAYIFVDLSEIFCKIPGDQLRAKQNKKGNLAVTRQLHGHFRHSCFPTHFFFLSLYIIVPAAVFLSAFIMPAALSSTREVP